jgi:hypothetical protein
LKGVNYIFPKKIKLKLKLKKKGKVC